MLRNVEYNQSSTNVRRTLSDADKSKATQFSTLSIKPLKQDGKNKLLVSLLGNRKVTDAMKQVLSISFNKDKQLRAFIRVDWLCRCTFYVSNC